MRPPRPAILPLLLLTFLLAACAGDISKPVAVKSLDIAAKADLRVTDITGENRQGVVMTPSDIDRITEQVRAEIAGKFPNALAAATVGTTKARVKIVFTQYDEGNAFARFMLAGLGQIRIDGDVLLLAADSDIVLAQYQVSKQFAFGGLYGGTTTIRDVEKGFAKSVAEVLNDKL